LVFIWARVLGVIHGQAKYFIFSCHTENHVSVTHLNGSISLKISDEFVSKFNTIVPVSVMLIDLRS
jgi:hypothetical protein